MDNQKFIELCKKEVVKYANEHLDKSDKKQQEVEQWGQV